MRKRHEFLLTEQDKTAIVSEMHRLRMRVVELEAQARLANSELARARKTAANLELQVAEQPTCVEFSLSLYAYNYTYMIILSYLYVCI